MEIGPSLIENSDLTRYVFDPITMVSNQSGRWLGWALECKEPRVVAWTHRTPSLMVLHEYRSDQAMTLTLPRSSEMMA
jgi:hypothetical protein